jgi:DNA-binding transcriptional MerR regulator
MEMVNMEFEKLMNNIRITNQADFLKLKAIKQAKESLETIKNVFSTLELDKTKEMEIQKLVSELEEELAEQEKEIEESIKKAILETLANEIFEFYMKS